MNNLLNLVFCGGTGMNLGKPYVKFAGKSRTGFADINVCFIDTSKSNEDESIPADKFFHIENADLDEKLDGSGKNREKNLEAINAAIGPILHTFPPAKFNVFISSGGGGSGSSIAPMLAYEVMERGHEAIGVMVGNTGSGVEIRNTRDTIATYESIVDDLKRNMAVWSRNNTGRSRAEVDKEVHTFLMGLLVMLSGQNRELDTEDYVNFFNVDRVSRHEPQLCFIDLFSQSVTLDKGHNLLSLLTVVDSENDSTESNIPVEYQAAGFINNSAREAFRAAAPIHLALIGGHYTPVMNDLKERLAGMKEIRGLNTVRKVTDDSAVQTRGKRGFVGGSRD